MIRNGGSDHQIAPSKKVKIYTDEGKEIPGVFGWPAIHTRKTAKEQAPSLENITIDVGASSKKEVEKMGIEIGNVIIFDDQFFVLNHNKYVCRALDNRMGGFMISQVAKMLHQNKDKLPFTLYVVNSVQEEVGLYGATMATQSIKTRYCFGNRCYPRHDHAYD